MPMKPKSAQFRPTSSTRAQLDKGLPSASPESHCRGASIPGRASATRPEFGMVLPGFRVRYGVPELRVRYGVPGTPELRVRRCSGSGQRPSGGHQRGIRHWIRREPFMTASLWIGNARATDRVRLKSSMRYESPRAPEAIRRRTRSPGSRTTPHFIPSFLFRQRSKPARTHGLVIRRVVRPQLSPYVHFASYLRRSP